MSKEDRFEWFYDEAVLKHYMFDNLNNARLGYVSIVDLLNEQDQQIADLEAKLAEKEERLKAIDNWKENYGYTNYEDIYMLEDLQSRAFQSEDDTTVVNELLNYFNISDENEILPTIKQQLEKSDSYKLRIELAGADETISQLKQQLAEKDLKIIELQTKLNLKDNGTNV